MKNKFNIVPIKRVDVYQTVISRIRSVIHDNHLSPGDRLPSERDLADMLNVSRSSIRQALKALETLGEVEVRVGSGTYVSEQKNDLGLGHLLTNGVELNNEFLQNLAEARAAIECKIVEVASEKGSQEDWSFISQFINYQREQEDDEEIGSLDLQFEKKLAVIANNPILTVLQNLVHNAWIVAWGKLGIAPDEKRNLSEEHAGILKALVDRDTERAILSMKDHVDRTIN